MVTFSNRAVDLAIHVIASTVVSLSSKIRVGINHDFFEKIE